MGNIVQKLLDFDIPECWNRSEQGSYPAINMEDIFNNIPQPNFKPMDQWGTQEVLEFILNEVSEADTENYLEKFQCISGYIFRNLTVDNCKLLSNSNSIGEVIFNAKERYIRCHPTEGNCVNIDGIQETPSSPQGGSLVNHLNKNPPSPCTASSGDHKNENSPSCCESIGDQITDTARKRQGRPRHRPISGKIGKRSEKLWEFLIHLLRDSKTCPQLIKWENFEEGKFRFVQSEKVARLWGNRKKNEKMTYQKFSRAMRYYYKSEVLLPVPGKRLVYRFGPQAKGWNNTDPIS